MEDRGDALSGQDGQISPLAAGKASGPCSQSYLKDPHSHHHTSDLQNLPST